MNPERHGGAWVVAVAITWQEWIWVRSRRGHQRVSVRGPSVVVRPEALRVGRRGADVGSGTRGHAWFPSRPWADDSGSGRRRLPSLVVRVGVQTYFWKGPPTAAVVAGRVGPGPPPTSRTPRSASSSLLREGSLPRGPFFVSTEAEGQVESHLS